MGPIAWHAHYVSRTNARFVRQPLSQQSWPKVKQHWGIKTVAYFVRQLSNNHFNLLRNAKAVRCKCQIAICLCWRWDILLWKNPMPKIFFNLTNWIKELHWSNFDFQRMMAHLTSLDTFGYFRPKWLPNFMLSRYYWAVFCRKLGAFLLSMPGHPGSLK